MFSQALWYVFFFPTVFLCSRLDTKRQVVSHDFSFVYLQQFTVIQVNTGFLVDRALLPVYYCITQSSGLLKTVGNA